MLDASYQGVKRLFLLVYSDSDDANRITADSHQDIFFQELKRKITTLKWMEDIFMISHLMTQLSSMMKLEKYQQDKLMIIRLDVY